MAFLVALPAYLCFSNEEKMHLSTCKTISVPRELQCLVWLVAGCYMLGCASQYPPLCLPIANLLAWQLPALLTLFCPQGYSLVPSQIKYLIGVGIVLLVIKELYGAV